MAYADLRSQQTRRMKVAELCLFYRLKTSLHLPFKKSAESARIRNFHEQERRPNILNKDSIISWVIFFLDLWIESSRNIFNEDWWLHPPPVIFPSEMEISLKIKSSFSSSVSAIGSSPFYSSDLSLILIKKKAVWPGANVKSYVKFCRSLKEQMLSGAWRGLEKLCGRHMKPMFLGRTFGTLESWLTCFVQTCCQ